MGFFPRARAQSEVVAYFGSEDPASSLEVYGGEEARAHLDTVLKGLAFNPNLSREEKAGLYKRASEIYQESLLYAMALCVNFEDLRQRLGNETAVAQTLVQGHGDPDYSLVHRRADELCGRLDILLGSLRTFGIIPWWRTTDWDDLATDLLKFPHPKVVPLVVEAIHRCSRPNLLRDLLDVFERAVELSPEPPQVDLDKLRQRLLQLTFSKAPLFHGYLKAPAERLCRRLADGTLLMKPFDGQVLHPWLQIGKALDPKAPASELIHLLRDVYPNRDPVWNSTDFGALLNKASSMEPSEEIPLLVAIAEHAYRDQDRTNSVIKLGGYAERGKLANEHLTAMRRIAHLLPPVEKIDCGSEKSAQWYQEALAIFRGQ